MSKTALEKLAVAVEDLQRQVAALNERVAQLEPARSAAPAPIAPAATQSAAPSPSVNGNAATAENEAVSPEILLAISAAVAAYMGERAHVRAVRLIGSTRWSQEGRVSIQASHRLTRG
jgi:methylmalonyl-CoA carboxyltransferase large subunit